MRIPTKAMGLGALALSLLTPLAAAKADLPALGACHSTEWTTFGGSVERTFATPDTCISRLNAATLRPTWFFNTSSPITAQPTVADHKVYAGTFDGKVYAVNEADGTAAWAAPFDITAYDRNIVDFGEIPGSAAVTNAGSRRVLVVGAGGTVFVIDANDGSLVDHLCVDRVDTTCQGGAGTTSEIETSPAVIADGNGGAQVLVGLDVNESDPAGPAGLISLHMDAAGHLTPHWWYNPETGVTSAGFAPNRVEHGCNDVWSSPSVDRSTGTVVFGVGNCNHPERVGPAQGPGQVLVEGVIGLNLSDGAFKWAMAPRPAKNGLDLDFGATANVFPGGGTVGEAGKDGVYYSINSANGTVNWSVKAATGSAIGGMIGSTALGKFSDGHDAVFAASAIPVSPNDAQNSFRNNIEHPNQAFGVHAIDATTHAVRWDAPAGPAYGAAVFAGGVVFVPDTFSDALLVLDGDTGAILRAQPMNVPPASPVAISGKNLYMGSGITENAPGLSQLAAFGGLWGFTVAP